MIIHVAIEGPSPCQTCGGSTVSALVWNGGWSTVDCPDCTSTPIALDDPRWDTPKAVADADLAVELAAEAREYEWRSRCDD